MLPFSRWLVGLVLTVSAFSADPVTQSQTILTDSHTQSRAIQSKVETLDDRSRELYDEYKNVLEEVQTLETYNRQLSEIVSSQEEEMVSLNRQIDGVEATQRGVMPLMERMINALETFVSLDVPFLPNERSQRIANLKSMIKRSDLTVSEKYRVVLEAYQVENDYGRTIEAYRAQMDTEGEPKVVDFLRIGRIALYYQTLDGRETGWWNRKKRQWEVLDSDYARPVKQGLRIARKQTAPDLLTLTVPGPGVAQ